MKNNFQKILLVASLTLFVILGLASVFLYKKINDNNQKAGENTIAWMEGERRRADIMSLDRSLEEITDDKALLEAHFAKSSDVVPFLDTLEKLAPKAGVKTEVDSVSVKDKDTGLVVGLQASGSFTAIYKFIMLLENSPYELDFLSLDIHKLLSGSVAKDSKWEAVFKIQLLSFIP
jgi:hypothetical protein